jgi:hypothetical protein
MAFTNPQTGYFSGTLGQPLDQDWFDAAFAGRINPNPIYKQAYNCDITQMCTLSTWLEDFMGYETSCDPEYTLLERNGRYNQIKVKTGVTIPANPSTGVIALDTNSHFVGGNYILPQVGNTLVLPPSGVLAEVTAVTYTTNASTITVRIRAGFSGTVVLLAGDEPIVLSGSIVQDCDCPTGQFRFDDLPIEHDLSMITVGDKGELCGDALNKCQWLKIPFTDECGNVIEKFYTQALQDMYKDFETRKHYERLFNPVFGVLPVLKSRGQYFQPALDTEITLDDIREWKQDLDKAGIGCRNYGVFAGREKYSQWQRLLGQIGVEMLKYEELPYNQPKWINMEYIGIKVEGIVFMIYEECSFSNGKMLGGQSMVYPNSQIFIPMCDRTTNCRGGYDTKMLTTVYFRDVNGRVWDNLTDSNGVLNGPNGRNSFGTGCEEHEWTIKGRFLQEIHCPQAWGYTGL